MTTLQMRRLGCLILLALCGTLSGNSLSDLRGLKTKGSRFPLYNNDRLQVMIYSQETERRGNLISTRDPVLDIISRGVDVDDVISAADIKIYPLHAPLQDIYTFWKPRMNYSDGIAVTSRADIDQTSKIAGGSDLTHLRSPAIDLDGTGFEADLDKRTVLVKKDVHIVARVNSSDPREIIKTGVLPDKYEFITAACDSLFIDSEKDLIRLIGNVKVHEPRADIFCDLMTLYLKNGDGRKNTAGAGNDISADINGVSRIVCEGNVVLLRRQEQQTAADSGRGMADRMTYDYAKGEIVMTGSAIRQPVLEQDGNRISGDRISLFRDSEVMKVRRSCRLELVQKEQNDGKATVITSDAIDFFNRQNYADLTGNVKVTDKGSQMTCSRMLVYFDNVSGKKTAGPESDSSKELRSLHCSGGVHIVSRGNAPASSLPTDIASEKLDYARKDGLITLTDKVKVRDPRMNLDCAVMKIFTAPDESGKNTGAMPGAGSGRLERVECSGDVRADEPRARMFTDLLNLYFVKSDGRDGAVLAGGSELVRITGDGNVKIENIPGKKSNNSGGGIFKQGGNAPMTLTADRGVVYLRENRSEFFGNVKVREAETQLDCRELYLQAGKSTSSGKSTPAPSIDDDPMEAFAETAVPSQFNIGEGRELKEVTALKDVVIRRVDPEKTKPQEAVGEKAHYIVNDRKVILTGTPGKHPVLRDPEQGEMRGRRVIVDLSDEQMFVEEDTRLDFIN